MQDVINSIAGSHVPENRTINGNDISAFITGKAESSPTSTLYYYLGTNLQALREKGIDHSPNG
ncbi:MAG: hypothetical protein ACOC0R_02355 [Mariniphaga sp.]